MRWNALITVGVGAGLLAAAVVMGGRGAEATAPAAQRPERPVVRLGTVTAVAGGREITLAGVVRAARRVRAGFVMPGRLEARPVEVGDRVAEGTVLARLDMREHGLTADAAAARLEEVRARLEQARREAERVARLAARAAATAEEVEQSAATARALGAAEAGAVAQLADARRRVEESVLTAPFAATVTAVSGEPGEWVAPGQPVVELAASGEYEVEVEAPVALAGAVAVGAQATVRLALAGRTLEGEVRSVGTAAPGPGRLLTLVVALAPESGIVPGMSAEVVLAAAGPPALSVPLAAVIDPGASRPHVLRVRDGRVEVVAVTPGEVRGDTVAVAGPLAAGDTLVVAGHTALADGDEVEVR